MPHWIYYRGAIGYSNLQISQGFTRFIEEESVPFDAVIVDRTWRFLNKSGGPDRRFSNNRQLPILQLGVLALMSSSGLNIQLNPSNSQLSVTFANAWPLPNTQSGRSDGNRRHSLPPPPRITLVPDKTDAARKLFEVSDGASFTDVLILKAKRIDKKSKPSQHKTRWRVLRLPPRHKPIVSAPQPARQQQ